MSYYIGNLEGVLGKIMDMISERRPCSGTNCDAYRRELLKATPTLEDGTPQFRYDSFDFMRLCANCRAVVLVGLAGLALQEGTRDNPQTQLPPITSNKPGGVN